jgi:hypothetical protein
MATVTTLANLVREVPTGWTIVETGTKNVGTVLGFEIKDEQLVVRATSGLSQEFPIDTKFSYTEEANSHRIDYGLGEEKVSYHLFR